MAGSSVLRHNWAMSTTEPLLDQLRDIVGPKGWLADEADLEPHLNDWRGAMRGRTALMVSPGSTEEVAAVVRACAAAGVGIVPQGGNTGLCGGALPGITGEQVLVNLSRMNRVRSVDAKNFSMVAEAGCILANLQAAARDAGCFFPLSLGAEGSCQIGGNLSTNAGGLNVIRYGTARSLVLGLEVVLPDGTVWDGIRALRKDTAGYDLKHLFIGSEGTLGIITAAALRLFPAPGETATTLLAIERPERAIDLLSVMQTAMPDRIQSFELVSDACFRAVEQYVVETRLPFDQRSPYYVLIEAETGGNNDAFEELLHDCLERGFATDAVITKSEAESAQLWRMRHSIAEAEKHMGKAQKHDVSVPISKMADFLENAPRRIADAVPGIDIIAFGHVGDGNLHYNVLLPPDTPPGDQKEVGERITSVVYDVTAELDGSFSAEHGVGYLKRDDLVRYRSDVEVGLMRSVKQLLDPQGIMNPGKVVS